MGSFNEKKIGVGKQVRDNDNNRKQKRNETEFDKIDLIFHNQPVLILVSEN